MSCDPIILIVGEAPKDRKLRRYFSGTEKAHEISADQSGTLDCKIRTESHKDRSMCTLRTLRTLKKINQKRQNTGG